MKSRFLTLSSLAACLFAAGCAMDSGDRMMSSGGGGNDAIHFASMRGGILDWDANENTIYVQDSSRQWYRGEFMSPCIGLGFDNRIGFNYEANGEFNRFSSIRHEGQTCNLKSLTRIEGGPRDDRAMRG